MPKHADEDLWSAAGAMHLYFNVSRIQPREGYQLLVTSAKLRLTKYAQVSFFFLFALLFFVEVFLFLAGWVGGG